MLWSDSRESVRMALETLRKNKLRSGLTVLGISIGIATVILISSAINGLNTNIDVFVKSLGTNDLWVFHFIPWAGRPTTEELNRKKLTYDDGVAMRGLPHVLAVDPSLSYQNFQLGLGSVSVSAGPHKITNTILNGNTTAVKITQDFNLLEGRLWTDSEEQRRANVAVLGHDAAEDLFPHQSAIGKDINVEGDIFTVIGVLDTQPLAFGSGRNSQDNSVYFPLGTFRKIHPEVLDFWITVKYDDPANKALVTEEVREVLRRRRNVRIQQDDNFSIFGPDSLARLWNQLTVGLFSFMVAVSSVGLMVGGVGVMNIMLVSVTERTREIGIRKAIGATRRNILLQFTLEAVTLCMVGGLMGVAAGSILTLILHYAISYLHASLSAMWVTIALGVSFSIGLMFGIYPAYKAASLDPIEALRYE